MEPGPPRGTGRSRVVAVLLSGLAPGAGHLFVGRPGRGVVFLGLTTAAAGAWIALVPQSWTAARLGLLAPVLLLLALLVDAGRLAPRAPRPPRVTLARAVGYAAFVVASGFVLPALGAAAAEWRLDVVRHPDEGMASSGLHAGDRVLCDRAALRHRGPRLDEVVAVEHGQDVTFRRVVGLPGERVDVRRGVVRRDGQEWLLDLQRPFRGRRLFVEALVVPPDQVAVLSDARDPDDGDGMLADEADLLCVARYVLLPADLDPLRLGEPVR